MTRSVAADRTCGASGPGAIYAYSDNDGGQLAIDFFWVENYIPEPAYHWLADKEINRGMQFQPLSNNPPMFLLEGTVDPGDSDNLTMRIANMIDQPGVVGPHWPPVLETSLSWLGAMTFGPAVLNYQYEPRTSAADAEHGTPNTEFVRTQTRLWVREGWEHIAAQGSYSRGASELLHALLPDMTNASLPPPAVRTLSSTPCNYPSRLPPAKYYGIEAIQLDGSDGSLATVAAASFRGGEPFLPGGNNLMKPGADYCAFVVVVNLCGTPTQYKLGISGLPAEIKTARHKFDANYPVRLTSGDSELELSDTVAGYSTSVLSLGCGDWEADVSNGDGHRKPCCGMGCGCESDEDCEFTHGAGWCTCQYQTANPYPPHKRCLKNTTMVPRKTDDTPDDDDAVKLRRKKGCPCADESLCKPLSPQPAARDELLAFPGHPLYGTNGSEWHWYDWSKVTSIAPFEALQDSDDDTMHMYCTAHKNNARVLEWSMMGNPVTDNVTSHCPVTELYVWARSKNSTLHAKMYDDAAVAAWASASAACVAAHGLDGVLLDMEGGGDSSDPAKRNQTQRDAIVKGVCALKQQLTAQIPGSVLFWTTDTVSAPSCAVCWR